MFYPVEYDPKLRIFNNQVDFYEFLAETNPEINVGLSALLPPTEFVVGEKHFPCRTIVDFFEQIAEQTGLPIDTKASTIRMDVILLFLTENLDESILTLQSGDANITLIPSVFKEVDAAFKVSVAKGYLWDPTGMPKKVTINDEQCDVVYAEDTQTFTIVWPKKRSQVVNLGVVPPDPIIREEWETSLNTLPNERALKENGTLKMGTGVRGTYATVANDGVIELALIPMIPGRKVIGPAGDDGIFTKTEKGDVSCFFGVTGLKYPLKDVIGLYDSITLDVISDGTPIQKMDLQLHNGGWYDKNGEMLEGTYLDEYTIQEATRVSFYAERGKEHKFVLSATSGENTESIEVTVIDEYVEPEPEPEPGVDPGADPESLPEPEPTVCCNGETTAPAALQDAESAIMTLSTEEAAPDSVDAILQQAAALEDEADKSGSKVALEAFAKQHGVSLARNKTFANMMKDFEAALRA